MIFGIRRNKVIFENMSIFTNDEPLRSRKAGRFEKVPGVVRSDSIVTRDSVSLFCATTPHLSRFSKC